MSGLRHTSGSVASLLLNMEGPFTVLLATLLFREVYGRRLVFGFILILSGGVALSFSGEGFGEWRAGALLIVAACLCWGFDNNFSKKVSSLDARAFAAAKGLIAGSTNLLIATAGGERWPAAVVVGESMFVGFLGYGLSLVFFILALRRVGAARTSAYFSTAPFVGAIVSLLVLHESFRAALVVAAGMSDRCLFAPDRTERSDERSLRPFQKAIDGPGGEGGAFAVDVLSEGRGCRWYWR